MPDVFREADDIGAMVTMEVWTVDGAVANETNVDVAAVFGDGWIGSDVDIDEPSSICS